MNSNYKSLKKKLLISFSILLFLTASAFFLSCTSKVKHELIKERSYSPDDYLIIWAHSDIQPRNIKERIYYESAIADINSNFSKVDIALVAGDIVHWSNSDDDYKWYLESKKKTSIKYWYEIAGNHDHKSKTNNYEKYIRMPLHYSVKIGNIIIICLSDETKSAETNISDDAFNFWKDIVINNQDKIIVTMTHGYLKQSGLFGSSISSRNIKDSERFSEILKKYKVDLWICGHAHLPHNFSDSVKIVDGLNGTLFINISSIRGGSMASAESYLLFIKKNTNELIAKSRDHNEKKFNMDDILYKLSHKFEWDNSPPIMKFMNNSKQLTIRSLR
ncbi:MAG: metallophosphoesterase [Spirochaetota bacterium]